jgi:hypothetical protein
VEVSSVWFALPVSPSSVHDFCCCKTNKEAANISCADLSLMLGHVRKAFVFFGEPMKNPIDLIDPIRPVVFQLAFEYPYENFFGRHLSEGRNTESFQEDLSQLF